MQTGLWKIQDGNEALREPEFDAGLIAKCLEDVRKDEAVLPLEFLRRKNHSFSMLVQTPLCQLRDRDPVRARIFNQTSAWRGNHPAAHHPPVGRRLPQIETPRWRAESAIRPL